MIAQNPLNSTYRALNHLVLLACALHWAVPPTSASPRTDDSQPYTISTNVNLVVLPVTVTDHEHQFVSGLDASQFRVYEEGRPQALSVFKAEDIPVTTGLVVDHSGSMGARKVEVIDAAAAFVRASNPQDEEFVVNFSQEVFLGLPPSLPFTSNPDELTAALSVAPASGMTALYDAIAAALNHIRNAQKEKKVLILITDGEDNASRHYFDQVLRMAQEFNVLIYSVGLFDTYQIDHARNFSIAQAYTLLLNEDKALLTQLAKETGGASYFPKSPDEVVQVAEQIASDIRHQYTLGYNPKDDGHGGYRKVRVKVIKSDRGKLVARTRTRYFFPTKQH